MSEIKPGTVVCGPEYVVELLDHEHKQVRLWLHSGTMRGQLMNVLMSGHMTILGHKRESMPRKVQRMGYSDLFLVPRGWNLLDSD
jgi:hypothetical protein